MPGNRLPWQTAINVAPWDSFWCNITQPFPGGSLPLDIQGPLKVKHVVNDSIGISPKLWWVHRGIATSAAIMAAIGEMLVWMSSREPSVSLMLAWYDVLTGGAITSDFWGGDMVATALVIFSREDCLDSWLDASIIAWSRKWLTSAILLPSGLGGDLCRLVAWMVEASLIGRTLVSDFPLGGMSITR